MDNIKFDKYSYFKSKETKMKKKYNLCKTSFIEFAFLRKHFQTTTPIHLYDKPE